MNRKNFPGNYQSLALISDYIVLLAEEAGFTSSEVYAIQTAVDEACANIIDHAYEGENIGAILIEVSEKKDRLTIKLKDTGKPFDPDDIPPPDITSPLEIRKERGLGIFFMQKLMDEVKYDFSRSKGNTLTLIKYKGE